MKSGEGDDRPAADTSAEDGEGGRAARLLRRFRETRAHTERLCEPLATEDYVIQSMPDASPVKWHLAHTTWFFETFVLAPHEHGYRPYDDSFGYLHNSYYEAVGARHPRARRGMLTRPTVEQVYTYRSSVDERIGEILSTPVAAEGKLCDLLELGVNHEGLVFQAAAVTDSPNAFPARGPWVTARTSASVIGMSGAMFFSTPSLV